MFHRLLNRRNLLCFGAVGETENRVGEGVEDFKEGAVDSPHSLFFQGVQVNSYLFPGREWPMEGKIGGKAMELNFSGKSVV